MPFDINDPYENHAFFVMSFDCNRCGAFLAPVSPEVAPSDEWCRDYAQQATEAGWYVPPATADGSMDIESCLCPRCKPAAQSG